jgi:hypothetical protein
MRTPAKVGIAALALAAAGVIGYYGYEKYQCGKTGGTFGFPFGPCKTGDIDDTHNCPDGQVWNGTECVAVSTTLLPPANFKITYETPTSEVVNCTASWDTVTGANHYVLTVNGQSRQVYGTSYNFTATAGSTVSASVTACD